jgi:hypothetical protein
VEVLRTGSLNHHPCALRIGGTSGPSFTFDHVFGIQSPQGSIFEHRVAPLVERCLEGYNATIIAYGQTGSGKTYTIMGPATATAADQDDSSTTAGVIPRAIRSLFRTLEQQRNGNTDETTSATGDNNSRPSSTSPSPVEYDVRVQFLELYGEEIRDLLVSGSSGDKLTIRNVGNDGEPQVVGATQRPVGTAEDALQCLTQGMLRRVTAATAMNEGSSRSHAILSILVEQSIVLGSNTSSASGDASTPGAEEHVQVRRSKFNFVDLAGSERQKRTQAKGKRLKEGIDINKGLLVLGNVISALGDPKKKGKTFVPYRDSKLTRLLKGSLGGNHKTLMIACVSPSSDNMDETLNCLRYANRAKNIQNNAVVNVDASSQLLTELKGQVRALASDLIRAKDGDTAAGSFTREALEAMAEGESGANSGAIPSTTTPKSVVTPRMTSDLDVEEQLRQTEIELSRTRDLLGQSQRNHDAAEEQLYVVKAEKQLYQLQMAVTTDDNSSRPSIGVSDKAFLAKVTDYEKEIGKLRDALQTAETKADRMALIQKELMLDGDDQTSHFSVERAKKQLDQDKKRLSSLRNTMFLDESDPDLSAGNDDQDESRAISQDFRLDAEAKAEEAELNALTNKYLDQGGHVEDDDDPDSTAPSVESKSEAVLSSPGKRQWNMQTDLVELSRGIAAKEDLIDQLKLSQEKYAVRFVSCVRRIYSFMFMPNVLTPSLFLKKFLEYERLLRGQTQANGRLTPPKGDRARTTRQRFGPCERRQRPEQRTREPTT